MHTYESSKEFIWRIKSIRRRGHFHTHYYYYYHCKIALDFYIVVFSRRDVHTFQKDDWKRAEPNICSFAGYEENTRNAKKGKMQKRRDRQRSSWRKWGKKERKKKYAKKRRESTSNEALFAYDLKTRALYRVLLRSVIFNEVLLVFLLKERCINLKCNVL